MHFLVFSGIFETVFWTTLKNPGIDNQRIVAFSRENVIVFAVNVIVFSVKVIVFTVEVIGRF